MLNPNEKRKKTCLYIFLLFLSQTDVNGIQSEEKKVLQDTKSNMADNIARVVLYTDASDGTSDTEVLEALEAKYDALKDKLLAKALIKEVCLKITIMYSF